MVLHRLSGSFAIAISDFLQDVAMRGQGPLWPSRFLPGLVARLQQPMADQVPALWPYYRAMVEVSLR